jgi:orotate phosphoribosyltransferase
MKDVLVGRLLELEVVSRQPVELRGGTTSDFYIDVKKAYGDPMFLDLVTQFMNVALPDQTAVLAAAGYGGIPLASALAQRFQYRLTLVRENPKRHGLGGWIDGYLPQGDDKVVIVDDVLTSGSSIHMVQQELIAAGAEAVAACVVVSRGRANLAIPVHHLLTADDLLAGL